MSNQKDYKSRASSLELFDISPEPKEPEPEEPAKPTKPQLRFLHLLSRNRLVFRTWPGPGADITDEKGNHIAAGFYSRRVADKAVLNGWAEMISFKDNRAIYKLSETGKELLSHFCEHKHFDEMRTEVIAGKLVCKDCVLQIQCRSKQPRKHGATRFHYIYRAMCEACFEYLNDNWFRLGRK